MSLGLEELENEKRWLILRTRVYEEKVKAAFRLFRTHGVEPILIKGWAAAADYPEKYERVFSDLDLCVPDEKFEISRKLIETDEGRLLNVDLHKGLRHLDTLEWEDLFGQTRLVALDDTTIRVLRPEDHLRVLCVHWLTDGGAYRERLLDIYYLLEKHAAEFDWERCFGKIAENRRDWIIKTIAVTKIEYGLDVSRFPFAVETGSVPRWLTKALQKEWASGTRLIPLHTLLGKPAKFIEQVKKRLPPNPIQATVEMEGRFDNSTRLGYQAGSVLLRLQPSIKRIYNSMKIYLKKK